MGEKIEPKINHLDNTENEVIVMRPLGNRPNSKTSRYDWPLIRLIAVILVVGFIWYSRVQQNLEVEAANALADKKAQQVDVQSQEQKQREAYYQGINERTPSYSISSPSCLCKCLRFLFYFNGLC
jgi:cytoskeletal protein RodZ